MSAADPDRGDEDFTVYAGLIFLAVGLSVFAILLGTAWVAFDRWADLTRPSTAQKWTLRAEVDP